MGISLGALMYHLPLLCLLNPLSVDYGFYDIWHKNGLKMKKTSNLFWLITSNIGYTWTRFLHGWIANTLHNTCMWISSRPKTAQKLFSYLNKKEKTILRNFYIHIDIRCCIFINSEIKHQLMIKWYIIITYV